MKERLRILKGMIRYYKEHKIVVITTTILTVLSVVVDFIYPYIVQYVFRNTETILDEGLYVIVTFIVSLIGIWLFEVTYDYVIYYKFDLALDKIQQRLEMDIFEKYLTLSHNYFDNHNVGDMISTVVHDVKLTRRGLFALPLYSLKIVLRILVGFFVFPSLSLPLYVSCVPVIILSVVMLIKGTKIEEDACKTYRKKQSSMTAFFEDHLSGIRTIISFGMFDLEKKRAFNYTEECRMAQTKRWKGEFVIKSAYTFIHNWLWFVILVGGVILLNFNMIDISTILAFEVSAYLISDPFCQLSMMLEDMAESIVGFGRIQQVLNERPDIVDSDDSFPYTIYGDIRLDNVTFRYEDDDRKVLNNLTLRIKRGEYVAIVGDSGGGKSTIASLIPRYYDVDSGSIRIGCIDIRKFELEYLRQNIGVVSQDVFLFSDTVLENIRIAKPEATDEEVMDAIIKANASDFIKELPKGWNSLVGEKGVKLSGGQKQRIAIARCILMKTPIIIFDEATSALDTLSEKKIQETINSLHGKCTLIVIAHRLSTIRKADRIVVIDNGEIVEEGTHNDLIHAGRKYHQLYYVTE